MKLICCWQPQTDQRSPQLQTAHWKYMGKNSYVCLCTIIVVNCRWCKEMFQVCPILYGWISDLVSHCSWGTMLLLGSFSTFLNALLCSVKSVYRTKYVPLVFLRLFFCLICIEIEVVLGEVGLKFDFSFQARSVYWVVTTRGRLLAGACVLAQLWGLGSGSHWTTAVVFAGFGKLKQEEKSERLLLVYWGVQFCWGKICIHSVTHFPLLHTWPCRQRTNIRMTCQWYNTLLD